MNEQKAVVCFDSDGKDRIRLYICTGQPGEPGAQKIDMDMSLASLAKLVQFLQSSRIDGWYDQIKLPLLTPSRDKDGLLPRQFICGADIGASIASTVEPAPAITGPEAIKFMPPSIPSITYRYDPVRNEVTKESLDQPQPTPAPEPEQKVKWREFL